MRALIRAGHRTNRNEYRPTDDEPFMCSRQRAYFRGKLLAWRNEILRSMKETRQHLLEDSVQHPDVADRASTEIEWGVELRARDRQRKLIAKIDAALARLAPSFLRSVANTFLLSCLNARKPPRV